MNPLLTTFWIELPPRDWRLYGGRFGVTAYSLEDALFLLKSEGIELNLERDQATVREGIRYADLEQNHVAPNIGPMNVRGVWFPWFSSSWAYQR